MTSFAILRTRGPEILARPDATIAMDTERDHRAHVRDVTDDHMASIQSECTIKDNCSADKYRNIDAFLGDIENMKANIMLALTAPIKMAMQARASDEKICLNRQVFSYIRSNINSVNTAIIAKKRP